jgi:hypothetical protein
MFKGFGHESRILKDYLDYQSDPSQKFRIWTGHGSKTLSTGDDFYTLIKKIAARRYPSTVHPARTVKNNYDGHMHGGRTVSC